MATSVNQQGYVATALRMPKELRDQLHAAAQESGRSFNAEMLSRLESSFDYAKEIGRINESLQKAQLAEMRYWELAHFFEIFAAGVRDMYGRLDAKAQEQQLLKTLAVIAEEVVDDAGRTTASALTQYLAGTPDPVAASRIKNALDELRHAAHLIYERNAAQQAATKKKKAR